MKRVRFFVENQKIKKNESQKELVSKVDALLHIVWEETRITFVKSLFIPSIKLAIAPGITLVGVSWLLHIIILFFRQICEMLAEREIKKES